jgi:hypothetical protein
MARGVSGTTRIEVSMGEAIPVANCSFDPGYSLESTFEAGDPRNRFTKADLVRGYCSYGHLTGERD